jgi:hypothetical protein
MCTWYPFDIILDGPPTGYKYDDEEKIFYGRNKNTVIQTGLAVRPHYFISTYVIK